MNLEGLSPEQAEQAAKIVEKCVQSRLYFIKEILNVDTVEAWQQEVIEALDRGETKISIRSGHGVGKTCLCAWLALHFLAFRDDVKVIITSPSRNQMQDGLGPEVVKWINRLPSWMSDSIEVTSERVVRHPSPRNNFISFRTARKENPEALAGVHASHVMLLVDEASGVDEVIYETGQGALSTAGAIAILIGNPTKPYGFFYKTQTTLSDLWWNRKVSCLDSNRVDADYIMAQARTYGVDSREYAVRVLGDFPESGADAVIPRAFVDGAVERYSEISHLSGKVVWGIDPGRGGDPTGFVERSANVVTEYRELRYDDLMNVVGWVHQRYKKIPPSMRPTSIYVDSIGLGAGVADRLLELGLPIVHVAVQEAASMSDRYANLRAEIWFLCREWFESREVAINPTYDGLEKLVEELCSVEQKPPQSNGKVILESKENMKARGVKSPNMGDALCLTFSEGGAVRLGNYNDDSWEWDSSKYVAPGVY